MTTLTEDGWPNAFRSQRQRLHRSIESSLTTLVDGLVHHCLYQAEPTALFTSQVLTVPFRDNITRRKYELLSSPRRLLSNRLLGGVGRWRGWAGAVGLAVSPGLVGVTRL